MLTSPNLPGEKHAPRVHLGPSNSMLVLTGIRKATQKELMRTKPFPEAKELVHSDFDALILN